MTLSKKIYPLFIFITTLSFFYADAQTDRAEQNIYIRIADDANSAMENHDFRKAESLLLEAITRQPENPMNPLLLSNLGMCRYYMGEDTLALATLDEAVAKAPASVAILLNRAKVHLGAGHTDSALADYRKAITLDSLVSTPYYYIGFIELSSGNFLEAEKNFRKVERLAPGSYESNLGLASLYASTGQEKKAIPYYTKLLETEKSPEFLIGRTYCYLRTGELFEAADDIATGISTYPEEGEFYLCRAILNRMRYLEADAKADAHKAIELGVSEDKVNAFMKK